MREFLLVDNVGIELAAPSTSGYERHSLSHFDSHYCVLSGSVMKGEPYSTCEYVAMDPRAHSPFATPMLHQMLYSFQVRFKEAISNMVVSSMD